LDLQKAFDNVNHEILLHKLYNYLIRGVAYDWFKSCLLKRQQYTVVNGFVSNHAKIKLPVVFHRDLYWDLFFLFYFNDIANVVPELNVKLFTNDTNLAVTNKDPFLLYSTANEAINKLNKWFWWHSLE